MEPSYNDNAFFRIIAASDFEVPQALVDEEASLLTAELKHQIQYQSLTGTLAEPVSPEEMDERLEELKREALLSVKARLIIQNVIHSRELDVSREELEAEASAMAQRQNTTIELVKRFLGEDLGLLRRDLLERKAIELISAGENII